MGVALKKNFNLTINGQQRPVIGWKYMNGSGYGVQVPAKQLVDNSPFGENPSVQGHVAKFDNNGNLLGVTAQGWNSESGFYDTQWPSKQDSVYNANAAKQYAPQVFKAFQDNSTVKDTVNLKADGGSVEQDKVKEFSTDRGLRFLQIDSPLTAEGIIPAGKDTVGILYNPSNNSKVEFKLGADGSKNLTATSGWLWNKKSTTISPDDVKFQENLNMIRELASKYKISKEKCGGKVEKHEDGSEINKEACGGKARKVKKSACGGKSKKLMRSGGRIIEIDF